MLAPMVLQNNILASAMQASVVRNDVINNNIANAETPGFKRKTVEFENSLRKAVETAKKTGVFDFSRVRTSISVAQPGFNYRIDENNVDPELEMSALYQNSVRYDTLAGSVINNYQRINMVLNAR